MNSTLEELGQRLWDFLKAAITAREPERDIPVSEALVRDILHNITEIGVDEDTWSSSLAQLVMQAVEALQNRPELWNLATNLASIYLSDSWQFAHPRADMNISRGQGPNTTHPVPLNVAQILLKQLLANATSEQRIEFLKLLDDWSTLMVFKELLPFLPLTAVEMAVFLVHTQEFAKNDGALGGILASCSDWARSHPEPAHILIRDWFAGHMPARSISARCIEPIIEGTVISEQDTAFREWVLSQLDAMRSKEAWELAVFVELRAWPQAELHDIHRRHAALIDRVRRMPEILLGTAIVALGTDAAQFPNAVLQTGLQLIELMPDSAKGDEQAKLAFRLVDLAARVISAKKSSSLSLDSLESVLNYVNNIPSNWNLWPFDVVVNYLIGQNVHTVRQHLGSWLEHQADSIARGHRSLEEMFSLVSSNHHDLLVQWLLFWMVAPSEKLRFVAAILFGRRRSVALSDNTIANMTEKRLRALIYTIVGSTALPGTIWIPMLFKLAIGQPSLLNEIKTVLLIDGIAQYPSAIERHLHLWNQAPWIDSANHLREELERNSKSNELKLEIPELSIRPSLSIWYQRQYEAVQESMREAYSRSITAQIATQIPIARGEGNSWSGDPDDHEKFSKFEFSTEMPVLDIVDPLAARMRRIEQNKLARELIRLAEEEDNARTT